MVLRWRASRAEAPLSINNGEFQSNDVVETFGKAFKVCGAFTGRCSRRYFANSGKNNFQIEKEHFVEKVKHTNPRVPSFQMSATITSISSEVAKGQTGR